MSFIESLRQALDDPGLVQSFSGVRASFGAGPAISVSHAAMASAYGYAYATQCTAGLTSATLLVGRDPRPTGEAVASELARGFIAGAASGGVKLKLVDLGIITTPLLQTAVRSLQATGGVMVTASHNPLTDNGFKFLTGAARNSIPASEEAPPGALVAAGRMAELLEEVRRMAETRNSEVYDRLSAVTEKALRKALDRPESGRLRVRAERAYLDAVAQEWGVEPHCLKPLTLGPALLDPNGGAASGINARVLEHFGVRTIETNAEIGEPEHPIDTDGIDPRTGKHMLLRVARSAYDAGARFGVAFDYDADRGNLVLPGDDESAIIPPQRVAALSVALALAHRRAARRAKGHTAVVVSDATSGASAEIAHLFGAKVFMVETGEINVVTRMRQLHDEGYEIPIGVEGANGGAIFGSSTCRDGLQTALCAALADETPAMSGEWIKALHGVEQVPTHVSSIRLPDLLELIPQYYSKLLRLQSPDMPHGRIKQAMESCFRQSGWKQLSGLYDAYDFANYEGPRRVEQRTGDESGGWRLELVSGDEKDFVFVRGSRTEAGVWRMITDSPNEQRAEVLTRVALEMFENAAGKQGRPPPNHALSGGE